MQTRRLTIHERIDQDGILVNVQVHATSPDSVYILVGGPTPESRHWTPKHPWSPPGLDEKSLGELIKVSG